MEINKAKEEIAKLRKQLEIWANKYYDEIIQKYQIMNMI